MAVKFTSVSYVLQQVTKNKTAREKKRQQEQRTHQKKCEWIIS